MRKPMNRRQFLKKSSAAAVASMMCMGGFPFVGSEATAAGMELDSSRRTLVFIMLDGGNDSFNMLVPTSTKEYGDYKKSRQNLALPHRDLLPLDGFKDARGVSYGLHPSLSGVQNLFARKDLSFLANVGPLIEPVNKDAFFSGSARLPLGLMSHSDQFKHWQSARPGERVNRGWFGLMNDAAPSSGRMSLIPMNISLAGSNIMQNGLQTSEYAITKDGSQGMTIYDDDTDLNLAIRRAFKRVVNKQYDDPFKQTYLESLRTAQEQHEQFGGAAEGIRVRTRFSDTDLSQQLKMIARSIKAAPANGARKQTYFVRYIGWDHHDELLNNHARMLQVLSDALVEFQASLEELGVADDVVTFTGSDFGRTLTSNGNGTDHGWGGNTIVMGNPVAGGGILGKYPSLTLGNNLDIGNGIFIPTTPVDALYAELALWFGVRPSGLRALFPNLNNFKSPYGELGVIQG